MTIVGLLFGGDWEFNDAFVKDRSALSGGGFDTAQMAAATPMLTAAAETATCSCWKPSCPTAAPS